MFTNYALVGLHTVPAADILLQINTFWEPVDHGRNPRMWHRQFGDIFRLNLLGISRGGCRPI